MTTKDNTWKGDVCALIGMTSGLFLMVYGLYQANNAAADVIVGLALFFGTLVFVITPKDNIEQPRKGDVS